jgi:hypothetical protein
MEHPRLAISNMLTTATQSYEKNNDEECYDSQEVFTDEKYVYLYYKGLQLLKFLYEKGISHGNICSSTLRIADDYTFSLTDFQVSAFHRDFRKL